MASSTDGNIWTVSTWLYNDSSLIPSFGLFMSKFTAGSIKLCVPIQLRSNVFMHSFLKPDQKESYVPWFEWKEKVDHRN